MYFKQNISKKMSWLPIQDDKYTVIIITPKKKKNHSIKLGTKACAAAAGNIEL